MNEQSTYDQNVQDFLNKKKKEVSNIPELNFSRIRLNGKTGEWTESVPDTENDGKFKNVPMIIDGLPIQDSLDGIILRVAYFYEYKGDWRPDGKGGMKNISKINRKTREFTDFRNEQIELLDFSDGRTSKFKVFPDQPAFKSYATPKDEEGNEGSSLYAMKASLYVLHLPSKKLYKLIVSGSSVSELFAYKSNRRDNKAVSLGWIIPFPTAVDISQIKTKFVKHSHLNPAGGTTHFLSFLANGICSNDEMKIVVEESTKIQNWVDAWKAVQKKNELNSSDEQEDAENEVNVPVSNDPFAPIPMTEPFPQATIQTPASVEIPISALGGQPFLTESEKIEKIATFARTNLGATTGEAIKIIVESKTGLAFISTNLDAIAEKLGVPNYVKG